MQESTQAGRSLSPSLSSIRLSWLVLAVLTLPHHLHIPHPAARPGAARVGPPALEEKKGKPARPRTGRACTAPL